MLTIDVRVPAEKFTTEQRRGLAAQLTANGVLASTEEIRAATDSGVLKLYESLTNVLVSEAEVWVVAGEPVSADGPSRYLVNVYVGAWGNEMAQHLIESVTARINEFDAWHDDSRTRPHVMVHVVGMGKGHYGLNGDVLNPAGFTEMIEAAKSDGDREVPAGMYRDPICGCQISRDDAVTLNRDGVIYGFCCAGCRGRFANRHTVVTEQRP